MARAGQARAVAAAVAAATLGAACLLAATGALGAGHGTEAQAEAGDAAQAHRATGLRLNRIASFEAPVHVDNAPGQPRNLYVVEQPGRVILVRRGRKLRRPFLDIRGRVRYGGEQGLLSIAFHPGYRRNRTFFVYYVNREGNIQVDRYKRRRDTPRRAGRASRRTIIEIAHPRFENHNGGQLQFGPDGLLYLGTGDGGSAGDPQGNAQNPRSLLGKLLRIKPGGKRRYTVPRSNPYRRGPGRGEIYAIGLRNPYRFSFDARTGALAIGDVGQNEWEEIDFVRRGDGRGANFGWDVFEGNHPFEGGPAPGNYVPPIHEYPTGPGGTCAVTGGYVVRDRGLPALRGRYVYGDFCSGRIRSLDPRARNPSATDSATGLRVDALSSFGEGARNRLYAVSLEGPVFRIVQR